MPAKYKTLIIYGTFLDDDGYFHEPHREYSIADLFIDRDAEDIHKACRKVCYILSDESNNVGNFTYVLSEERLTDD